MSVGPVVLALLLSAHAAEASAADRVDAALSGLQRYFFDDAGSFWKACGQNGGLGKAPSNFDCKCEVTSPFCKNCYRWWMAVTVQSLLGIHAAVPDHPSLNTTKAIVDTFRRKSPYTTHANPAWAYIDDYVWYVLMWLDVHGSAALGEGRDLTDADDTMELMTQWGADPCGGIHWMYPDVDPRKNAITTLEAVQASAQLATALKFRRPIRAREHRQRALAYWRFFQGVHLLGDDPVLVHDNVTGTAHGLFHCCNGTTAPLCEPRDTITWTYNQGMLLGAMSDLHKLTGDVSYLKTGAQVLDAVVTHLTRTDGQQTGKSRGGGAAVAEVEEDAADEAASSREPEAGAGGRAAAAAATTTVLREPKGVSLTLHSHTCDATHDPSAPAGGDLFSFKGVFFQHLPRFLASAKDVLSPAQLAAARKLVGDSADAAWSHRVLPPFSKDDVCNEHTDVPAGAPPKFTWDWATPAAGALTCQDARTQSSALSLFVAELRLDQMFGPREGRVAARRESNV